MNRYFIPVFLVLLSLFIYQFYIVALRADLGGLDKRKSDIADALKRADDANETLAKIVGHFESLPTDTKVKLDQIIPEKNDSTRLLIETTEFLEKNGFSAKGLTVIDQEPTKSATYRTHLIKYSTSASYQSFKTFLNILEKSMALRDIVSVSFDASPSSEGGNNANSGSLIRTYNLTIISYSLQ